MPCSSRAGASAGATIPQLGRFNVANVLGVLGCLVAQGIAVRRGARRCSRRCRRCPGACSRSRDAGRPLVVVDYAHTPDALDKVLRGAAAGRARARRAAGRGVRRRRRPRRRQAPADGRGRRAARRPRRAHLRQPARRGPAGDRRRRSARGVAGDCVVELDRAKAIDAAIAAAAAADVVLIAGKGHEAYQEIAGRRLPFSDAAVAERGARPPGGAMMSLAEAAAAIGRSRGGRWTRASKACPPTRAASRRASCSSRCAASASTGTTSSPRRRSAARPRALVDERFEGAAPLPPCIVADDTRRGLGRLGRHWRLRFAPRADRGHRLQRQDHHQGNARLDPARARGRGGRARDARQPEQRHRRAADAAPPARRPPLLRDRARHEPPGRDRACWRDIARPTVALVNNAQREHLEFMQIGRGGGGGERRACSTRCPPTAWRC